MSDRRVLTDVALLVICDELSDAQLAALAVFAENTEELPDSLGSMLAGELTSAEIGILMPLFRTEAGRLQVFDAVGLERHARRGGV